MSLNIQKPAPPSWSAWWKPPPRLTANPFERALRVAIRVPLWSSGGYLLTTDGERLRLFRLVPR